MTSQRVLLSRLSWFLPLLALTGLLLPACTPETPTADSQVTPAKPQDPVEDKSEIEATDKPVAQTTPKTNASLPTEPVAPEPLLLEPEELAEGWIRLFDGATFYGWQPINEANWQVQDGAITVSEGDVGLLCTTTRFRDYELKLQFKAASGTNSGIFLRTPLRPTDPSADCYELNIAPPDNPFPTGSLVAREKYSVQAEASGWQQFHVTVEQGQITVLLDGEKVVDYLDPTPLSTGFIGLQLNQGAVAFRDIKLKPLGMANLFNGKDLTGWKSYPEMASRFSVSTEGWLNVQDGHGQLETESLYADFVLQLECITHAPELNSGIFFRCIPGEQMNGYECQIHNGFKEGDPTKPVDCGSGGIFRRINARRLVAQDQEWFQMTLVVDGARITSWVNGYQTADWTDRRPPDSNPRRGLRTEAGSIMIQGHDPTTNISFRQLRIAETGN